MGFRRIQSIMSKGVAGGGLQLGCVESGEKRSGEKMQHCFLVEREAIDAWCSGRE